MEPLLLKAENQLDPETGYSCSFAKNQVDFKLHYHDYYEFLLVMKGEGVYTSNGTNQILESGTLIFIRDFDVHSYVSEKDTIVERFNLGFSKDILYMLFEYLGKGFPTQNLLTGKKSPSVILSEIERNKLFYSLSELLGPDDKDLLITKMKIKLFSIFTKYFHNYSDEKSGIPSWLEYTYEEMQKPKNFISGLQKMYKLSGKSPEHLSRTMKKHYGISPTQYITDLRINHCANLLLYSNISITDICYECGFDNMSWFYSVFQKKFNMSPKQYRNKFSQKNI